MDTDNRPKSIRGVVIYSLLVLLIAWLSPLLGGSPSEPGLGFILWATSPLLVALLMRTITKDWSDIGLNPGLKQNWIWYIVSFVTYPVLMTLALLIGVITGTTSVSDFSMGEYLQTVFLALPVFFIFAIFEEIGWRGYLVPKLATIGLNRYLSAAILALVWTLWHVPYLRELTWIDSNGNLLIFTLRYYLVLFAFSIFYGEIRFITSSVWTSVLIHAVNNSFGHPLDANYITIMEGNDYLASISTGVFIIIFVALTGIAIREARMRHMRQSTMTVSNT